MDRLHEMMARGDVWSFGGVGIVVALGLIVLLRIVLPREDRRLIRVPLFALLIHVGVVVARALVPQDHSAQTTLSIVALFFILVSIGRSVFLVLAHVILGRRSRPLPKIFRDLAGVVVYAAVVMIVLRAAGVKAEELLTTSALLTAVIGLSLQDTLGNMFAGLAIQAQRPFEVGDWIQFDQDREHIGHVLEINWRATKVLTLDQVEVIVPNATLAKAPIVNYSRPKPMVRRSVYVTAPYDVPPARVREVIVQAIRDVSGVLGEPPPTIVANDFTESGVQYWVRFFTNDFQLRDVIMGNVRERIWYGFERAGIRIPAPIRQVRMTQLTADHVEAEEARHVDKREKALRKVDFLAALDDTQRRELAIKSKTRLYSSGETILRQGEGGDELFIIQKGEVAVFLDRGNGSGEVEVARLGAGKFFGEMGLMTGEKRRATVRAMKDTETTVVGKVAFSAILDERPELAETISKVLAERDFALGELANASPEARNTAAAQRSGVLLSRIKEFFSL